MGFSQITNTEAEALAEAEWRRYAKEHPRSPSALWPPRILFRGRNAVAMLPGTFGEDVIGGVGATVWAALEAFDAQFRKAEVSQKIGARSSRPD